MEAILHQVTGQTDFVLFHLFSPCFVLFHF